MSPKYFPNPKKFDLDRFKGKGSPPLAYIPFGGGPHICLGYEFARLEMVVFLNYSVFNYEWSTVDPNEKVVRPSFPSSKKGFNSNFVKKILGIN
jgi:cytochrome P450 family 26 subfamily A